MRAAPGPGDTRPMNVIEVTNLVKHYGDHTAVDGLTFAVEEGEIFAILGPNGAGKTTTVESISGDDHQVVRDGLGGLFLGDPEFDVVGEASDGAEAMELAAA
jgi:ABC-type sugar transport system ATPase subunit